MIITGVVLCIILLALILLQVPVGASLALVGFVGLVILTNLPSALGALSTSVYSCLASYSMSVVPLFVLMGYFAFQAGLSHDVYRAASVWLSRVRGGMAIATIIGCGGFAACCGSSVATGATMTAIALPEMRKYGYSERLITGSLAAGGVIGILIPPSICFVIYGIITEQSIGKLFMAGILPGILEILSFIVTIQILCRLKADIAPATQSSNLPVREKLTALVQTWPIVLLFGVVIGGIYGGIFTPTEAGGVGAFGALILMLVRGKLDRENFTTALSNTARTTAMVFFILIGATIFGYLLAVSQLPMQVAEWIAPLPINRYLILAGVLIFITMLGLLMDTLAIILLVIPVIFPAMVELGFDPIWFGVIIVKVSEIALITPPVGLNVYVVKGAAPDVELLTIFRGIIPFLIADVINVLILIAFPQISLFLPGLM
ncbi:MAG: TRAP transporter large permease [Desulfopila sp.]